MKKIALIILSLFVVFISSDSFAQRKGDKKMEKKDAKIEKEVANLTKKLSLTSAQVPEVTAAVSSRVLAQKDKKDDAIDAFNAKMKEILTDEQDVKFDKIAEKREDRRENRMENPRERKEPGDKMAEELGLDDTQKAAFSALMAERRDKMKEMREGDKEKGEGKEMREEYEAKIKAILTAEQFAKYQKMKEDRRDDRRGDRRGKKDGDNR